MIDLISSAVIAQSEPEPASGGGLLSFAIIPLMLLAMYFLIIRPNSKKRKEQVALQSALAVGDEIMTTGGIIGTITGEDGPTRFWLEIDDDVQIRIARGGVQGRIADDDPTDDTADDDVADTDSGATPGDATDSSDRN